MPIPKDLKLIETQAKLHAQALDIIRTLGLTSMLEAVGKPVLVGSAAYELMTSRDIDITVVCDELDKNVILSIRKQLTMENGIKNIYYRDDSGIHNQEKEIYPDGLYLQVRYIDNAKKRWNIDLWFVVDYSRQPDLNHLKRILPRLNDENRLEILRIKSEWMNRSEYGQTVNGHVIYTAVLDHDVHSIDDFKSYITSKV